MREILGRRNTVHAKAERQSNASPQKVTCIVSVSVLSRDTADPSFFFSPQNVL